MDKTLDNIEVRVLACLVEKEFTTPDYYPLTLNSLVAACNQKSNRNPVVTFDEPTVERALESLRKKGLVQTILLPGSRTSKYKHSFLDEFKLIASEASIICELMLRGPQTLGELRTHAGRMYEFKGLQEIDEILKDLMDREPALVIKLQREPGKREERYMHLLSGMPEEQSASVADSSKEAENDDPRIAKLEKEVSDLRDELAALRSSFETFKSQF